MRIIVIDVVEGALAAYLSYAQTFGQPLPTINKSKRKRDRDELYWWWWLDLTYYDIGFFGDPNEKTDHLINDENINIDWCYVIYQIIYYYVC